MPTPKQLAANRANAKKSTGPRTAAGKLASSRNSYKHGLTGLSILRTPEEQAAYEAFESRLLRDLAPANDLEYSFAVRIAAHTWRLEYANCVERTLCVVSDVFADTEIARAAEATSASDAAVEAALAFQSNEKSIARVSLYMSRIQRSLNQDLDNLRKLQTLRLLLAQETARQSANESGKESAKGAAKAAKAASRPTLQVVEKQATYAAIGFVPSTPVSDPAPPPETAVETPENMVA